MIKSQATICRIYLPVEYADYLEDKRGWIYGGGRVKQKIKANKIAGKKEWAYLDWIMQERVQEVQDDEI